MKSGLGTGDVGDLGFRVDFVRDIKQKCSTKGFQGLQGSTLRLSGTDTRQNDCHTQ